MSQAPTAHMVAKVARDVASVSISQHPTEVIDFIDPLESAQIIVDACF